MIFMTANELVELLAQVDPEMEVVVGKIEANQFKTAFIPEKCAVIRKKGGDENLFCIFYTKTLKKEKGELN